MAEFVGLLDCVERNATHEADFSLMRLGCLGKDVAASLASNTSVTSLNLTDTKLGHDGSKAVALALSVNSTLTDLNVQFNALGDDGARALSKGLLHNEGLVQLDMRHNFIESRGARALAASLVRNTILRVLDLSHNPLQDAGVSVLARALKKNNHIHTLKLRQVGVGDSGCQALAEALLRNSSLTLLDLEKNFITQIGGDALAHTLHHNQTLRHLNLARNQLGIFTAESFARALFHNTSLVDLNLSGDTAFGFYFEKRTNIGLYGVIALKNALKSATLYRLNLAGNDINPIGVSCIADFLTLNQCLTHITLSHNKIGCKGAEILARALSGNHYVTHLDVEQNGIGVHGAKVIAAMLRQNTCLRELNFSWNPCNVEGALSIAYAFKYNRALARVNIGDCVTRASAVIELATALKVFVKGLNAASSKAAFKSYTPSLLELAARSILQRPVGERLRWELELPDELVDVLNSHQPCLVCTALFLESPLTACKISDGVIIRSGVCTPNCFHVLFPPSSPVLFDDPRGHAEHGTDDAHAAVALDDDQLSSTSSDFDTDLSDLDSDLELSDDDAVYRHLRCRVCHKPVDVRAERATVVVVCSHECESTILQYESTFHRPLAIHVPEHSDNGSTADRSTFARTRTIASPLSPLGGQWSDDEDALLTLSDDDR